MKLLYEKKIVYCKYYRSPEGFGVSDSYGDFVKKGSSDIIYRCDCDNPRFWQDDYFNVYDNHGIIIIECIYCKALQNLKVEYVNKNLLDIVNVLKESLLND